MNAIAQYFEWHYLPFLIPFLLSLIMVFLSQVGGLHHGHGAGGHAHDIHGGDAHGIHHGVHHDAHHAGHQGGEKASTTGGALWHALSFFGVGKLPLMTLLFSAGLVWGLIGFIANMLLQSVLATPTLAFLAAFGIALVGTLTFTHLIGRLFALIIPPESQGARKEVSLLGEIGTAQSSITSESGTVLLRSGGDTFRVSCRVRAGEDEIPSGERVQLIAYEPTQNLFYANALPAEQPPKQKIELLERS